MGDSAKPELRVNYEVEKVDHTVDPPRVWQRIRVENDRIVKVEQFYPEPPDPKLEGQPMGGQDVEPQPDDGASR